MERVICKSCFTKKIHEKQPRFSYSKNVTTIETNDGKSKQVTGIISINTILRYSCFLLLSCISHNCVQGIFSKERLTLGLKHFSASVKKEVWSISCIRQERHEVFLILGAYARIRFSCVRQVRREILWILWAYARIIGFLRPSSLTWSFWILGAYARIVTSEVFNWSSLALLREGLRSSVTTATNTFCK